MSYARSLRILSTFLFVGFTPVFGAQEAIPTRPEIQVTAHLAMPRQSHRSSSRVQQNAIPAVIWLKPVQGDAANRVAPGGFTLLQQNKMFLPHLLVVPVGSSVAFPNADPFFHNVFSLFDGRRFDLGLYEAGSTRSVTFSREGVSYIFCNIHSEMSAVVISLSTPYHAVADAQGFFHLRNIPEGDYEMHIWVEGRRQNSLEGLTHRIHIAANASDLGEIGMGAPEQKNHTNKFGRPYDPDPNPIY